MLFFPKELQRDAELVTVVSQFHGDWLLVRYEGRTTFTLPTGRKESSESMLDAAWWVANEANGGDDFTLWPVAPYIDVIGSQTTYGQLYYAGIRQTGDSPSGDVADRYYQKEIPSDFEHSPFQQLLIDKVRSWQIEYRTLLYCVTGGWFDREKLKHAFDNHYIDSIFTCPDGVIKEELSALAKARHLPVRDHKALGKNSVEVFSRRGFMLFDELLKAENGCSLAVGVHDDLLGAILHRVNAVHTYKEKVGAGPGVFRLEFIDDVLIGAENG